MSAARAGSTLTWHLISWCIYTSESACGTIVASLSLVGLHLFVATESVSSRLAMCLLFCLCVHFGQIPFHLVHTGFANEYRPMLQSSLQQLVVRCTSLLHLLLPQEDKGNPPRYVALCRKLKLTQKVSCFSTVCPS